jgi:ribose 5-phosphate isomerase B
MKIAIASDHGGFLLKDHIIKFLSVKHEIIDLGCKSADDKVDYPDFAVKAAEMVRDGLVDYSIMIDGAGVGSTMAANKVKGVRAALCNDLYCANNSKEHNNANMLVMGSMVVGNGLAEKIVDTFIGVEFAGGRHNARVDKINLLDNIRSSFMNNDNLKDIIKDIVVRVLKMDVGKGSIESEVSEYKEKILTEEYLRKNNIKKIKISQSTIILPLAKDYINANKIEVVR